MSDDLIEKMVNDEEMDLELLQFDTESYNYHSFNQMDEIQIEDQDRSNALTLGQLQQEVIDEHEHFLSKLNQMVEIEREHVDKVYKSHKPAVDLNIQLQQEIELMREKIEKAGQILAKMVALLEQ